MGRAADVLAKVEAKFNKASASLRRRLPAANVSITPQKLAGNYFGTDATKWPSDLFQRAKKALHDLINTEAYQKAHKNLLDYHKTEREEGDKVGVHKKDSRQTFEKKLQEKTIDLYDMEYDAVKPMIDAVKARAAARVTPGGPKPLGERRSKKSTGRVQRYWY